MVNKEHFAALLLEELREERVCVPGSPWKADGLEGKPRTQERFREVIYFSSFIILCNFIL